MPGTIFTRVDLETIPAPGSQPTVKGPFGGSFLITNDWDRGLTEAVSRALCASGYPRLRDLEIEHRDGIVILRGRVPTYHQKQLAQAAALRVEGVREIVNEVEVVCDERDRSVIRPAISNNVSQRRQR
jgi:BON domain